MPVSCKLESRARELLRVIWQSQGQRNVTVTNIIIMLSAQSTNDYVTDNVLICSIKISGFTSIRQNDIRLFGFLFSLGWWVSIISKEIFIWRLNNNRNKCQPHANVKHNYLNICNNNNCFTALFPRVSGWVDTRKTFQLCIFIAPPPQLITGTLTLDGMKTSWLAAVIQTRATEPNGPTKILCWMPFGRNPPNLPQLGTSPHYAGLHIPGPGYTKMHNWNINVPNIINTIIGNL